MKRLTECLNNTYGSYIIPFFWQHGESREELLAEIEAIEKSGAKEFCVESRVYEDFCGENWWKDFGFILEEAKNRNMRVWLLDDKRFPTGYANGSVADKPELKKKHIRLEYVDVFGKKPDNAILINGIKEDEELISVTAYKRSGEEEIICGEGADLTQNIQDGLVFWDIPEGIWRVYFVIKTNNAPKGFANYIDILNKQSCRMQIEAVYEPQYEHFKEYFGNTFAGFFSDEPSFGNDSGNYNSRLGKEDMLLPWSGELLARLTKKMNVSENEVENLLPLLWAEHRGEMYHIRYAYMDTVSEMYRENFSDLLGDWCREHGVMYMGHIIEDMNTHMRLGYGPGHFFRAMSGQDISGCDIVLNQMISGIKEMRHTASVFCKCVEPEFFTYTLAKLASSDSHINKRRMGRAFCEIFGAFGWAEGVPMMKQLADHMLVSGINHFVPHAFNIKYPDYDCPPHFYIGGRNSQFEYFGDLIRYMQRMCHILSGGEHKAGTAVLYNAEAEWCGGEYELFQKGSKILLQNQIDFDFVPADCLKNAEIKDGALIINGEEYRSLVVSYSEVLPRELMNDLEKAAKTGLEVIFLNEMPKRYAEEDKKPNTENFVILKNEQLADYLKNKDWCDIKLLKAFKYLRYYHINRNGKEIYMFLNEDILNGIDVEAEIKCGGKYIKYNAWENSVTYGKTEGNRIRLKLEPSEATVIIFEEHNEECAEEAKYKDEAIKAVWKIYLENNGEYELFDKTDRLYNLARKMPRYCGKVRYECNLNLEKVPEQIEAGNAGEIVSVWVNGKKCADAVNYPYRVEIGKNCVIGENRIVIEVTTNLGYRERDDFSRFLSLPPIGIAGDVKMRYKI